MGIPVLTLGIACSTVIKNPSKPIKIQINKMNGNYPENWEASTNYVENTLIFLY